MAGEYKSIADGAVLLATLVLWNMALDGLAYHVPLIRRIVEPPALPLVLDGRPLRQNLRREWITLEELQAKLREHGIENMASVKRATLEPDGELSVLEADGKAEGPVRRRRPAA